MGIFFPYMNPQEKASSSLKDALLAVIAIERPTLYEMQPSGNITVLAGSHVLTTRWGFWLINRKDILSILKGILFSYHLYTNYCSWRDLPGNQEAPTLNLVYVMNFQSSFLQDSLSAILRLYWPILQGCYEYNWDNVGWHVLYNDKWYHDAKF